MLYPDAIQGEETIVETGPRPLSRRAFLSIWPFRPRHRTTLAGVEFEVLRGGASKRRYLLIHGDEETAREVLRRHMKRNSGVAYLVTGHKRDVPLRGGGLLDPNRMYSREGAERNLKLLNPEWTAARVDAELDSLDRTRGKLIRALTPPPGGLLVAVHNNSHGYSVETEVPISGQVSLRDARNPHEFFLATDPSDFRILALSPYNAVLQNKAPREDDGSLSRLMAKRGVRYANLEVALGKFDKQKEMLDWLERNLP